MNCRGVVKDHVVVLEEGADLPDGARVEVRLLETPAKGSPAALLEVWGSELPPEAWDVVEQAIEELDRRDRERHRQYGNG